MKGQPKQQGLKRTRAGAVPLKEAAVRLGRELEDWRAPARAFPVSWPEGYLRLAEGPLGAPIRRMGIPEAAELVGSPGDLEDPVGESLRSSHPCIVQKHADRAILIVTARCHFYCRFCFRRQFPSGGHAEPGREKVDEALEQLLADPRIEEIILSGGDPLTLDNTRLAELLGRIAGATRAVTVRIHSRAPVHAPERVDSATATLLATGGVRWLVTHFNHAVELTEDSIGALERLRGAGISLLNQSVLLAGVNDSAEELAALCKGLYRVGVKPYYLHHPDRTLGNASFRVRIERGLDIHRQLQTELSGPALPSYVIDLPDGSGKVPVASLERLPGDRWRAPDGGLEFDDVPKLKLSASPAETQGVGS